MILLTTVPIDVKAAETALQHPAAGGIVTFAGVVRNHNHGRQVLYLDYEAYPEMAQVQLATIATTMRRHWPLERLVLWHRTGRLAIGDVAVFVGVATAHRDAAFEACRYGIDAIKTDVPIWKKETFVGGEVWVDTCCSSGAHDRPLRPAVTDPEPTVRLGSLRL